MVKVTVERTISCSPEAFLEFVMAPKRYAEVDDKLGPISWVRRTGNVTEFKFRPKLPGMSLPEPMTISHMALTPGERVDVHLPRRPRNMLNRWVARFQACFVCERVDGGTMVRRTISFDFNPLLRWFFEPVLRRTLPGSVERELRLAQNVLESQGGAR